LSAIFEIHFLGSVLEVSNADEGDLRGDNHKGFDAHPGKGVENEHGLLARECPEIEKDHDFLAFFARPFLLSLHEEREGKKLTHLNPSVNMLGNIFQNETGGGRREWYVTPLFEIFGEKRFDPDP
jgi:hypothetical protein